MTYDLAVKVMLLHHHGVNTLGVPECQEAEASRAAGSRVAHDCTFTDFTKL